MMEDIQKHHAHEHKDHSLDLSNIICGPCDKGCCGEFTKLGAGKTINFLEYSFAYISSSSRGSPGSQLANYNSG